MVDRNDTLLREVDEELRRERFEKLWKQYSSHILVAAAVVVALVAGYKVWEGRRQQAAEAAGASYVAARQLITENKLEEAVKPLEKLATSGQSGFAALARLQLAANDAKAGRSADALKQFEALAKDSSADPLVRDFAALQAAGLRLADADWTEMQNRLNPLVGEKSPWRANARELLAYASLKAGKAEDARATLQQLLADRNTPPGVAERVRIAMARIVEDELAKVPATSTAAAPTKDTTAAPAEGTAKSDVKK